MKRLLQVALAMGSFSAVNLVVGFARSKYGALALGPGGIGLFAQANVFLLFAISVCTLNLGTGIVKRLSEAIDARDNRRVGQLLDTTFQLLALTGVGAAVVLALGLHPAARFLFGYERLEWPFLAVIVAIPLAVISQGLCDPILLGADRYDLYTRASLLATLLGFLPFAALTYQWGLVGAIVSIGVTAGVRLVIFVAYALRAVDWRPRLTGRLSPPVLRSLAGFSVSMLFVAALLEATNLGIRTLILKHLGAAANGLYQAPVALGSYAGVFFTNALWGHFYPRVSRRVSATEHAAELNAAFRFIALGGAAVTVAVTALRKPLIVALYSGAFAEAAALIPWYVLGELLYLLGMVYTVSLLAVPRLGAYAAIWTTYCVLRVALAALFITRWGLLGAAVAHAIGGAILVAAGAVYHARALALPLPAANVRLVAVSVLIIVAPLLLPLTTLAQGALQVAVMAIWLLLTLTGEERALAAAYLPWLARRSSASL